jgi:hypothetical protein
MSQQKQFRLGHFIDSSAQVYCSIKRKRTRVFCALCPFTATHFFLYPFTVQTLISWSSFCENRLWDAAWSMLHPWLKLSSPLTLLLSTSRSPNKHLQQIQWAAQVFMVEHLLFINCYLFIDQFLISFPSVFRFWVLHLGDFHSPWQLCYM